MRDFAARLLLALFFLAPLAHQAEAQNNGRVVATCGSLGSGVPTYTPGATSLMTLDINGNACILGSLSIAGSTSNASSGVATSGTNLPTVAYTYGFNGTTWDQLQVDGSKNLKVNVVTGGGGSQTDQSVFTAGTTAFAPGGGVFNDAATLSSGQQGTFRMTTKRAQIVDTDTSGNALYSALIAASPFQALSSEQTKATTGNPIPSFADLVGKLVTSPYANRENMARGAATLSGTSAGTILAASGSGSLKEYITDITCTRNDAGTTAAVITLNDTATTIFDLPNNGGGGGFSHTYNVPLAFAANTAATATSGTSITSIHCSATGFYGY